MMTPKSPTRHSQYLLLSFFLLLCFGATFYTYYKPTLSWFPCSTVPLSSSEVCSKRCLDLFEAENLSLSVNTSIELNSSTQPTKTQVKEENETVVLIWKWPFGFKFGAESCAQFSVSGCFFTEDRKQYNTAHAVMFHLRDIYGELPRLLELPRPAGQKWVWMNMESPDNSSPLLGSENLFNLTSNFRRDSDIWVPYGRLVEASKQENDFKIPTKNKLVCWIVSHWSERFRRVEYFTKLSKHIQIEAYGGHFGRPITTEVYEQIMPSCKFYLAFENSIHRDYFTEKLFNPLMAGTVPVVLGPPRDNYEEYLPADSFIHVDDFGSPQELAEHLQFLDKNPNEYKQYFLWRRTYEVKGTVFGLENACRICEHVRHHKEYRVFKNINKWYWG